MGRDRHFGWGHLGLGILALVQAATAGAWSSKDFPLFQPVHQMAIANVLQSRVSAPMLQTLQDQQTVVDNDQQPFQSFEHSMTGIVDASKQPAVEKPIFMARSEQFIQSNLNAAILDRQKGHPDQAMVPLGRAMHALEDATSPAHKPFQTWRYDESYWDEAMHVDQERTYPDNSSTDAFQAHLEGAVRWAYDIYTGGTLMPVHFFTPTGDLDLPDRYLGHP